MKLLEKAVNLGKGFNLPLNVKTSVYCQYCGEDVTSIGAKVSESGIAYCQNTNCIKAHAIEEGLNGNGNNFLLPKQLQKAIKEGVLKRYELIEKE
jgi:hypothetical protein